MPLSLINIGYTLIVAVVLSGGMYLKGRSDASNACDARHEAAQVKQDVKERKTDAKRDREKPVSADRSSKLDWLRQYTSPQ